MRYNRSTGAMKHWILVILFIVTFSQVHAAEKIDVDSIAHHYSSVVDSVVSAKLDKHLKPDHWVSQLVKNRFNVYDTTLNCPKFVNFCLDVYRWGDKTFNSYDSSYVYSCPQKWKLMFKVNTKWDLYSVHAHDKDDPSMFFNTEPRTSAGFRISFMALGFEYMPDIDNLITGRPIYHRRTRFTFTCSRVIAELYYNKNTGISRINRFGDYNQGHFINEKFDGLTSKTLGLDVFYVFNHKKYAHAAAYCFSKIQRRSAGSFILGIQYADQYMSLDLERLPEDIKPYNPWGNRTFRVHHYDYAVNVGYGYNWVFHRNWLFNVIATPSIGLSHFVIDDIDNPRYKLACNVRSRMALVRNCGRFFYGFHASFNGFFCWSNEFRIYNQNNDVTVTAGMRF